MRKRFEITETLSENRPASGEAGAELAREEKAAPEEHVNQRIGTVESAVKMGRHLAEQLEEQGYHPVVVFGSSNSGKTSMLASLLAYLQVAIETGVEIQLGAPIVVDDHAYGQWAHDEATTFFHRSIQEWLGGVAHAKTISPNPFFIPVIIRPQGNLPEARFAFLEGNGEWYQPDADTNAYFKPLKEEISGVLRHFQKGASFIHVAPFTQIASWEEPSQGKQHIESSEMSKANLGLVGAINSYNAVRTVKHRDAHLFLITKWDAYAPPGRIDGVFSAPALEEVESVAKHKYQQSYAAFANMNLGDEVRWRKQIMQYCAGMISGREILKPTAENKEQLNRYPRVLWNWLYNNATRDDGHARDLFPKPVPRPSTVFERFERALARVLKWMGV
jgi:hypothetical protein